MEPLSPIQKLDEILKFLGTNEEAILSMTEFDIFKEFMKYHPELKGQKDWGNELRRILNKLIRDNYVRVDRKKTVAEWIDPSGLIMDFYSITFEGKLLIDEGGSYENILIQEKAHEKLINDQIQSTIDTNKAVTRVSAWNVRLFWVTLVIAIGTIAVPVVTFLSKEKEISRLNQVITQKDQEIQRLEKLLPGATHQPGK